ncbi:MAG: helix-turn-helix transcriptional regulator [Microbacteriaceae bacterium]
MSVKSSAAKVPVEERLFSLMLALLATDAGLTKAEILSTVQGYRQSYTHSGDNSNLERKFERDKDDIRELGVLLETVDDPVEPGNNQKLRYRVPRGSYELPDDIRFTAEEVAVLGLAAMVWREGSLSAESRRALVKLRALGVSVNEPLIGYAPRVLARDTSFEPLSTALDQSAVVSFAYLKPGEASAISRTLEPLALVQHQGRWHVYGREVSTDLLKTFLLRRIVGPVKSTGTTFVKPPGDHKVTALGELQEVWESHTATVIVEPGTDAASRLSKREGTTTVANNTLELHYSDINIVADELASFGPEVFVRAPEILVHAVRARLALTAAAHG